MKRVIKNKKLFIFILIALVVTLCFLYRHTIKIFINPNAIKTPNTESNVKDCGNINYHVKDTYSSTPDTKSCFMSAWKNCSQAQIQIVRYTVEGDPIVATGEIKRNTNGTCSIQVVNDSRADKFGEKNILRIQCASLDEIGYNKVLVFTKCKP